MDKFGFETALRDLRKVCQEVLTLESEGSKRFHCIQILSLLQLLFKKRASNLETKNLVDAFVRQFLARLECETRVDIEKLRLEPLKRKFEGRIETFRLVGNFNLSPHLMREVKSLCDALVAACTTELNDAMLTSLGRPKLTLVQK